MGGEPSEACYRDETRARIDLPKVSSFRFAEIGSASTRAMGPLMLFLKNSWGLFAKIHLGHTVGSTSGLTTRSGNAGDASRPLQSQVIYKSVSD